MDYDYALEVIEYSEAVMKQRELDDIEQFEYERALKFLKR